MAYHYSPVSKAARYLLGVIRVVNGGATLFAPAEFAKTAGIDPDNNPAAIYMARLFGIRTVVIGAQLFLLKDEELEAVLRPSFLIHASDLASAALAGMDGSLPRDAAKKAMLISSLNTALALLASTGRSRFPFPRPHPFMRPHPVLRLMRARTLARHHPFLRC